MMPGDRARMERAAKAIETLTKERDQARAALRAERERCARHVQAEYDSLPNDRDWRAVIKRIRSGEP